MRSKKNINMQKNAEQGSVIVIILLTVFVLAGMAQAYISVIVHHGDYQKQSNQGDKAFVAAESGIDYALALANDSQFNALAVGTSQTLNPLNKSGANTAVDIFRLPTTQTDLDGDGIPETTTHYLRAESLGNYGVQQKKIVSFFNAFEIVNNLSNTLPNVEAAVMIDDPFAQINFNGNSFVINGSDENIDGSAGPNAPVYGMGIGPQSDGTAADPQLVIDQLGNQQQDNVTGLNGIPSVGPVSSAPIASVIATLAPFATISIYNYSGTYTGNFGDYATNTPELTYIQGDIDISGGSQGYGIMLVDGNLTISGNWDYVGLMFVNGRVTFSGGGNTKKVTGSVFVAGDLRDLELNGNIAIQYSSEAVANVSNWLTNNFTTTQITSWSQVSSAVTAP